MRNFPLFALLLGFSINLAAQTPIFQLSFTEETGSLTTESISELDLPIDNHFNRPERVTGPFDNALRLDGYSTLITSNGVFDFNGVTTDQVAIEAWYATECFNASTAGLFTQITSSAGIKLGINPFGKITFQFFAEGSSYFTITDISIPTYRWNHIVAQVDLAAQVAKVYLNGEEVGERTLGEHSSLSFTDANVDVIVGRGNDTPTTDGFITSTLNGAIDELRIYAQTFTPAEIQERYNAIGLLETELEIDPDIRHQGDYLRPQYHFMPNTLWANEAYGFTYFNDRYHVFFQKNPNASILNFMHWGHLSSPDLVSWKEERIALRPESDFSSVGKWSGTTFFDENNEPVIAFTGVNGAFAGMGIAEKVENDLIDWNPVEENPVIPTAPGSIPNQDFRDPYVWKEGDLYYMIVGSGRANNGGGILMSYTSEDYINWNLIPPIFEASSLAQGGRFWEVPYFNRINDTDYLCVVTPQFVGSPARTIYWVGSFDGNQFQPYNDVPKDFELIRRNFLAPAIGRDEEDRLTYIGIIPEDRNVEDQIAAGWRQTFSIPRVLRLLEDGETLGHYPHPNLCRARSNEVLVENRTIESGTDNNLAEYRGIQSELYFQFNTASTDNFSIQVYKNDAGSEQTSIVIDKENSRVGINRVFSSPYNTAEIVQYGDYTFRPDDTLNLTIFLDHSICEVFVDNLVVLSARVYPSEGSDNIDVIVEEGSVELITFKGWDIGDKSQEFPDEVCEPEFLPGDLFSSTQEIQIIDSNLTVYPNPTQGQFQVNLPAQLQQESLVIRLYSSDGRLLETFKEQSTTATLPIAIPNSINTNTIFGQIINPAGEAATFRVNLQK